MTRRRVVIVEGRRLVAEALAARLESRPELAVTGVFPGPQEALGHLARQGSPEVFVLGLPAHRSGGLGLLLALRQRGVDIPVVLVAGPSPNTLTSWVRRWPGVHLVSLEDPPGTLEAAVVHTASASPGAEGLRAPELSVREREVLEHLVSGWTARESAEALGISPKTVESYRGRLREKIGLSQRAALVRWGLELG